jgi:hypothetical protein
VYEVVYHATVTGTALKERECECCHEKFVYPMTRTEEGWGGTFLGLNEARAEKESSAEARASLRQVLAEEFEIIACPNCGKYQPEMAEQLRYKAFGWKRPWAEGLLKVAILPAFSTILAVFGAVDSYDHRQPNTIPMEFIGSVAFFVVCLLATTALVVIAVRWQRQFRRESVSYDPHPSHDAAERIADARAAGAMTLAEFQSEGGMEPERLRWESHRPPSPPPPPPTSDGNPFQFD